MKGTGLTESVMAQLGDTPKTNKEIVAALPAVSHKAASAILSQKVKSGYVVCSGEWPNRMYSLAKKGARDTVPKPAPTHALRPSIGLQCKPPYPVNPANGTCRDALRAVLESNDALSRTDLIGSMPSGFAPAQILSEMSDAIAAGWLRSTNVAGEVRYELCDVVPDIQQDPLAAAFVPMTPRQRVDQIQGELNALLSQMVGDHASPTVIHHIAAANHNLHQLHAYL